jgi:hypothetical protein
MTIEDFTFINKYVKVQRCALLRYIILDLFPIGTSVCYVFVFPSASNFRRAALDKAASPARASPLLTLLAHDELGVDLEAGAMPLRDRLCKTAEGDSKSFPSFIES